MELEEFKSLVASGRSPGDVVPELEALWLEARGDWERAHLIVQERASRASAWVHAYLHRKEGDRPNARYWYHRAARPPATGPFDAEWDAIVSALL